MEKLFGEVNPDLNLKILEISGVLFSKKRVYRKSKWEREPVERMVVSLTDESSINKIYRFPKLNDKQLETVLYQKLQKDMEFIAPLSDSVWVFSKRVVGSELLVLVSLIDRSKLQSFGKVYALTLTPQVIFNALNGRLKKNFMLVHTYDNSSIIFVFHEGYLDYIQSIAADRDINDSIELAREYYKERKKVDISQFYFSGDSEILQNSPLGFRPVSEILKSVSKPKFLIPELLSSTKVPFLISNKRDLKFEITTVALTSLFIASGVSLHLKNGSLQEDIQNVRSNVFHVQREVNQLRRKYQETQQRIKDVKSILAREDIKAFLDTRKPEVVKFLEELEPILKDSHSYLIFLKKNSKFDSYEMNVITFCRSISSPEEFDRFVSSFKQMNVSKSVRLVYTVKYPLLGAIMSTWIFEIEETPYATAG